MNRNKFTLFLLIAIALLVPLSACKKKGEERGAGQSVVKEEFANTFRYRLRSEPPSLDWSLATDNVSAEILFNIMDGLLHYDSNLYLQPALAESWDISRDGTEYTFHIRKGVKWSDGVPLKAQDFVYSWRRLLDPGTGAEYAYFLYDIRGAKEYNLGQTKDPSAVGISAPNDETLVVKLNHSAAYFLHIPTFWVTFPQRKDIVEKRDVQWPEPGHIVTLGPFLLKSWEHDYKIVLEANPHYYKGRVAIDRVIAYIMNEDSTALSLYENGGLDVLKYFPAQDIPRLSSRSDFVQFPFLRGYYYGFNVNKPPFNDKRVRQAFSLAIDRSEFPKILKGNQIPATSWIPKGMLGYDTEIGLGFDAERAKKLLAEAGYPNGQNFPKVTMEYDTREDNKVIAEKLQEFWKKQLNVQIDISNQEWKVYLKRLQTDAPPLFRLGWGADYPDPDNFMNLFTSTSGNNQTNWKNGEYDALIAKAAAELYEAERVKLYRRAQVILTEEEVPIMPLFIEAQNMLVHPRVKNFKPNAMAILQIRDVRLDNRAVQVKNE
ncbi:MAG: peptide ABC transporter substrate-binding protein [Deltaproteobacteria bacterium]|nr:peptide ABC transporter substrate-binding protein [Deltaproteobacteria bacterium]